MRNVILAVITTALLSVGITHSVMQEQTRQEVDRVSVESFNDGFMDGTCRAGTDGLGNPCTTDYRQEVIRGTYAYGPCESMRKTEPGRIMYWDMVSDSTDNGHKRSTAEQIKYVRQGCRNGA